MCAPRLTSLRPGLVSLGWNYGQFHAARAISHPVFAQWNCLRIFQTRARFVAGKHWVDCMILDYYCTASICQTSQGIKKCLSLIVTDVCADGMGSWIFWSDQCATAQALARLSIARLLICSGPVEVIYWFIDWICVGDRGEDALISILIKNKHP